MGSNFRNDLKLSNKQSIIEGFNKFYRSKFGGDIIIKRYDKDMVAQRDYKVDVMVILPNGIKLAIDEKIRRYKYAFKPEYVIELDSNVEMQKKGWLYTSISQYICFGDTNKEETGLLNNFMFPIDLHFKQCILNNLDKFKVLYTSTDNLYHTRFCLVHWRTIQKFGGRDNCHQLNLDRYFTNVRH